jgi:hypothetical protein
MFVGRKTSSIKPNFSMALRGRIFIYFATNYFLANTKTAFEEHILNYEFVFGRA